MKKINKEMMNLCCNLPEDFRNILNQIGKEELQKSDLSWLFQNFTCYTPRQQISRFLVREKLFELTKNIQGSIAEFGVFSGFGLLSWLQLKSIYKPLDNQKKIIGFDTFEGFKKINKKDQNRINEIKTGDYAYDCYDLLYKIFKLHEKNSYLPNQIQNIELVKGDLTKTFKEYLSNNPHTLFSLIYIDIDLYEPTKTVLENILPRMTSGSIIAFDQINIEEFPGETIAFLETFTPSKVKLKNFDFDTKICFMTIE